MRAIELRHNLNRDSVLMALYFMADDDGLEVAADNKWIRHFSGRSEKVVSRALRELEDDGTITKFDWRDGMSGRFFVLMDHPKARAHIEMIREAGPRSKTRRS